MKNKKIGAVALAATMTAVPLVGCGGSGSSNEQKISMILQGEPKTIDQSKSTDSYASQMLSNCQDGLTRVTQDGNGAEIIEPGIAENWELGEDGVTWTFHLRDAKWSDGKEVTAEDFVYGITRTLDKETASQYAFLLYPIKNAEEFNSGKVSKEEVGVKAIDDKTVQFTLKSECAYFLDLTYFRVMLPQRQDVVEKAGQTYGTEADTMVFCGPFKISNWTHNSVVEFEKNENYWDAENVKLDTVEMKILTEPTAAMQELYNGSIDVAGVNQPEWIKKFDDTNEFDVYKGYDASVTYTYFNQAEQYNGEANIFSNAKVRKAFILAENRDAKIQVLRKGIGEPALGVCPPEVKIGEEEYRTKADYLPVQDLMDENADAKALLSEGLKELGMSGDTSEVTITYLQSGTDTNARQFAEFQQQSYETILGIKVEVDYVEWPMFTDMTSKSNYQIAGMAWSGDYNDPNTFFDMWVSDAGIMPTGWKNDRYDELIEKAAHSNDEDERTELFKEAEKILVYEDGVLSPESWRRKNTYVRKKVKNYSSPMFGKVDLKHTYIE